MGPDALGITCEALRARLGGSRRAIKVALLDQHALAGVGNLYASEILHRAGIHPATPCHRLRGSDWPKLHAALGEILRAAIRHQGSTLRDGTYRIARNNPAAYQLFHHVYQRAGELCLQCRRRGSCGSSRPSGRRSSVRLASGVVTWRPSGSSGQSVQSPPSGYGRVVIRPTLPGLAAAARGVKLAALGIPFSQGNTP